MASPAKAEATRTKLEGSGTGAIGGLVGGFVGGLVGEFIGGLVGGFGGTKIWGGVTTIPPTSETLGVVLAGGDVSSIP
jgi:hypothetical protein